MGKIYVLADDAIEHLLSTALVGRIACCATATDGEARPFLVPLAYGYDGDSAYAVSGPGRKIAVMRAQPLVSFEVDEAVAEDRWSSVIADGVFEELLDDDSRTYAHRVLFGDDSTRAPFTANQIVYRLRLTRKTGRFELPDHETPEPAMLGTHTAPVTPPALAGTSA